MENPELITLRPPTAIAKKKKKAAAFYKTHLSTKQKIITEEKCMLYT